MATLSTIYTYSDGRQLIAAGTADPNMATGDIKAVIVPYNEAGFKNNLFPRSDWNKEVAPTLILSKEVSSDAELDHYVSIAKDVVTFVNTGNNGRPFDYDACLTDKCMGGNSNTLQALIMENSKIKYNIPKGIKLPGIQGTFYDGPFDNYFQKVGAELQKEQP